MTPEEKLTQVEKILETVARYTDRHEKAIIALREQQERLTAQMAQLSEMFSEFLTVSRQQQETIRQNQEEIRRIWEYLLRQNQNGQQN